MIVVLNGLCHIVGWRISVVDFYLGESGNSYFNTGVEISMDQFYFVQMDLNLDVYLIWMIIKFCVLQIP